VVSDLQTLPYTVAIQHDEGVLIVSIAQETSLDGNQDETNYSGEGSK
jgi:hypothetical protein